MWPLVLTSPAKWCNHIRPTRNMSLKSASDVLVTDIGKVMLFAKLGDVYVCVHLGVVDNLAVPLLIRTSFIKIFFSGIFPIEHRIVSIWSCLVAITSKCNPCRTCWLYQGAAPMRGPLLTTDRTIAKEHFCAESRSAS